MLVKLTTRFSSHPLLQSGPFCPEPTVQCLDLIVPGTRVLMSHSPGSLGQPEAKVCPVFPQTSGLCARPLCVVSSSASLPGMSRPARLRPPLSSGAGGLVLAVSFIPHYFRLHTVWIKPLEFISIACTSQAADNPEHQTADGQERELSRNQDQFHLSFHLCLHI